MTQRNITANKPTKIKSATVPLAQERELERLVAHMIAETGKRFKSDALGELNKSTVEQFADAQTGSYSSIFLKLAKATTAKLRRQFPDDRIEQLVATVLNKVNRRNRGQLYGLVEDRIGISSAELAATEGLKSQTNALILETSEWVKKSLDDSLSEYTANSLRAMTLGEPLDEIMKQFDGLVEKRKNQAKFTARNQIANFNSISTKIRAQNLGITQAIWRTSKDERVRECHRVREGKEFELDKGLFSSCDGLWLLPGVDYQCRCDYELIIPED